MSTFLATGIQTKGYHIDQSCPKRLDPSSKYGEILTLSTESRRDLLGDSPERQHWICAQRQVTVQVWQQLKTALEGEEGRDLGTNCYWSVDDDEVLLNVLRCQLTY